jgi:hypothetical protein
VSRIAHLAPHPGSNISFALAGPPRGGDLAAGPN